MKTEWHEIEMELRTFEPSELS